MTDIQQRQQQQQPPLGALATTLDRDDGDDGDDGDDQYDILAGAAKYVAPAPPRAPARGPVSDMTEEPDVRAVGRSDREFLDARSRLREELRIARPAGTEFLRQAKAAWINSRPAIDPYMPQHHCTADTCTRVRVTMRVFVRGTDVSSAHLCLYDHQRRVYLCGRETDDSIHSPDNALVDDSRLYFCDRTGRVHVCGNGMCLLAGQDMRRQDDYQLTCPVTGEVIELGVSGSVTVGSAFWRSGDAVGSAIEQQTVAEYDACLSPSADDLSRLNYMHAKEEERETLMRTTSERQRAARKRKASTGRELDKFIRARSETGFVSRKKVMCPLWLEWGQRYAEWDSWLDMLLQMQTHEKIAAHLREIVGESYRRVWLLQGVVLRYVAGLVYAVFCRDRYDKENRSLCHDMVKSIKRAGSLPRLTSSSASTLPLSTSGEGSDSDGDAVCPSITTVSGRGSGSRPMIFSQLVDTTMGSLALGRHGDVYTNSAGGESGGALALVPEHSHSDRTLVGSLVLASSSDDRFASGELHSLRMRVVGYTHRILRLWMLVNETAVDLPAGSAAVYPRSRIDCFTLAHFVFAALNCLAYGINAPFRADNGSGEMHLRYIVPPDEDLMRTLPSEWTCMGSDLFEHGHVKLVQYNVTQTLTTAVSSGRLSVEQIVMGRMQQQRWSDVDLEAQPWTKDIPTKIIFRNPPHTI